MSVFQPDSSSGEREGIAAGVLVIRHGLTQWNTDQRWQGWADIPLSETGRRQATHAAKSLARLLAGTSPVRIVSSDLKRAYDTAAAFAGSLNVSEIERFEALRERHVGDWSGLTTREINQRWPGLLERWRGGENVALPGGEDEAGFRQRIFASLEAETRRAAESRTTAIIVSHGGAIRTIESILDIGARHVANVGGRWFFWNGNRVVAGHSVDLLDGPESATEFERGPTGEQPAASAL